VLESQASARLAPRRAFRKSGAVELGRLFKNSVDVTICSSDNVSLLYRKET